MSLNSWCILTILLIDKLRFDISHVIFKSLMYLKELIVLDIAHGRFLIILQISLGMPFLWTYPLQYISKAFDLGRVFLYTW